MNDSTPSANPQSVATREPTSPSAPTQAERNEPSGPAQLASARGSKEQPKPAPGVTTVPPPPAPADYPALRAEGSLAKTLSAVSEAIREKCQLSAEQADTVTLWCAWTNIQRVARTNPCLAIVSNAPASGKTRLMHIVERLAFDAVYVGATTPAGAWRWMDGKKKNNEVATLLLDEGDTVFRDDDTELVNLLNNNHDPNSRRLLTSKKEDNFQADDLRCGLPLAVAQIGNFKKLASISRSIYIPLERIKRTNALTKDPTEEYFKGLLKLRDRLTAHLHPVAEKFKSYDTEACNEVPPRTGQNWRLLFAIADKAGEDWPKRVAEALKAHEEKTADLVDEDDNLLELILRTAVWCYQLEGASAPGVSAQKLCNEVLSQYSNEGLPLDFYRNGAGHVRRALKAHGVTTSQCHCPKKGSRSKTANLKLFHWDDLTRLAGERDIEM